jgi:hypothetical protein
MKKLSIKDVKNAISRDEMRKITGGSGSCPSGQFKCTCNGVNYGCVSSISACWNKC